MLTMTVLLTLVSLQSTADGDAAQAIAGLIESTDRLEHFRAVYRIRREGKLVEFEIDYLAPDRLSMRMREPERSMCTTIDGEEIWMVTTDGQARPTHGAADWLDRGGPLEDAQRLLTELVPLGEEIPLVFVRMDWGLNATTGKTDLSFSVGKTFYGVVPLCGWLHGLAQRPGDLALVDGRLIHDSERVHVVIDASTGFLSELKVTGADGSTSELTLDSLDLEIPPERVVFLQPKAAKEAEDTSAGLGMLFRSPSVVRVAGLHRFYALVENGERELDEALLDDLCRFLSALHGPQMTNRFAALLEESHNQFSGYGKDLGSRLAGGTPVETLEREAGERRRALERRIEYQRGACLGELPAEPTNVAKSATWLALRAAEDNVYLSSFDERFGEPLLADYDAAVAEALGH
ncbi:MAG: hypothetical protein WD226_05720 [Planctomycetota bacterium]